MLREVGGGEDRALPGLRRRALAALLLLVCLPAMAPALDPDRRPDQYLLRAWTVEDGLPQRTVARLLQTRDSYLWIGTQGGLGRFDGVGWTVFGPDQTPALALANVKDLLEGEDGSLWAAAYGGGLVRYRDGDFELFGRDAGLPSLLVRALAPAPEGGLWVGTEDAGVVRFDGARVVESVDSLGGAFVRKLLVGRSGELWIGTDAGGLHRLRDGRLTTWRKADGLLADTVTDLLEERAGALWIATSWGLQRLDGDRFVSYGLEEGLPSDYVFALGEDRDGNLWVGTGGGGLARLAGGRFASLGTAGGLPDDYVWSILEDREGSLWVGTESGLARLRAGPFVAWGSRQGLSGELVRGLREARDGSLLLATPHGLDRLRDGRIESVTAELDLPASYLWSILETAGGDLWLSTDGAGLVRIHGGETTVYTVRDGLGSDTVWSLAEDSRGTVWAGTMQGGLAYFAGDRWRRFTRADGLGSDVVQAVLADRAGDVWAGTTGGGLARVRGGRVVTYTVLDGLPSDTVLSLYEDADGNLWIGTLGGGLAVRLGGRFLPLPRDSLDAVSIGAIVEDDLDFLWLSTDRGLQRARRSELLELARGTRAQIEPAVFGAVHGLTGALATGFTPASWRARDGRLWFATASGAVALDPRAALTNPTPPPVVIEALLANHEPVDLRQPPVLAPGTFDLELRYAALSLGAGEAARFRYRLEGFDRDWVEAGERRVAYYTNLPPGRFRFRVTASNEDGVWSPEGAALAVRLLPRFHQTAAFKALLAAGALLVLYGLHRLRTGRIRTRAAVAEERNRLAREIHDTVAQDLASILIQAREGGELTARDPAAAAERFDHIAGLAADGLAEARSSLLALRSPALDGEGLAAALRHTARLLTAGTGPVVEVRAAGERPLAPAVEVELLRIGREAMANAIRHAGAGRVEVDLELERERARLVIADDGRGFDSEPATSGGGFGLLGMRERAEALGGTIAVTSAPGAGTRIEILVPLEEIAA